MAEVRRFKPNPHHDRTAELIGHVTRSVLATLPAASVEWSNFMVGGLIVTVVFENRRKSYAFGTSLAIRFSIADLAKSKAADLCEAVRRG